MAFSTTANPHLGSQGFYSTSQVQDLHLITTEKDQRLARGMKHLSLLNIAAILVIATLMQWVLVNGTLADFRQPAIQALAAFLIGALAASLAYGTRTSAVVLRLTGSTSRFRVTMPAILAMLVGLSGFIAGSVIVYQGMVGTL